VSVNECIATEITISIRSSWELRCVEGVRMEMYKRGERGGRARLDARFLALVHDELLEFLLVAVAEFGEVDVGEAAAGGEGVHL
jgi:hypothetical protein